MNDTPLSNTARTTLRRHKERGQANRLVHRLVHERHLSIRAARAALAQDYGIWRSVGSIAHDLEAFECPACAEPEHLST